MLANSTRGHEAKTYGHQIWKQLIFKDVLKAFSGSFELVKINNYNTGLSPFLREASGQGRCPSERGLQPTQLLPFHLLLFPYIFLGGRS